jgi:hypothetical protein
MGASTPLQSFATIQQITPFLAGPAAVVPTTKRIERERERVGECSLVGVLYGKEGT